MTNAKKEAIKSAFRDFLANGPEAVWDAIEASALATDSEEDEVAMVMGEMLDDHDLVMNGDLGVRLPRLHYYFRYGGQR